MKPAKVVIAGGSGFLGSLLAREFHGKGIEVVILSRHPVFSPWRVVEWDGHSLDTWAGEIDGADVIVNLAGRSVHCRYNERNRQEILRSRLDWTSALRRAIADARRRPLVCLKMPTAAIAAHRTDAANDEFTGIIGGHEAAVPESWRFSV